MTNSGSILFDASQQTILDGVGLGLRAQGWARHVTVDGLLREWQTLCVSVDRYTLTIDDYTNDLCGRDGLEIALMECPEHLRSRLGVLIGRADKEFVARTEEDSNCTLGRYFRIDDASGWWWKRRPAVGPLADYLAAPIDKPHVADRA